jgi:hypothetical protein
MSALGALPAILSQAFCLEAGTWEVSRAPPGIGNSPGLLPAQGLKNAGRHGSRIPFFKQAASPIAALKPRKKSAMETG